MGTKAGGGGQVKTINVCLAGLTALAATTAGTIKLLMPERGKIIGISLDVANRGGTHGTNTLDVLKASTSLLAALFDIAALTPGTPVHKEGTALAAAADEVAKDAVLSFTVAVSGGTSPTWAGVNVQLDYVPLGD